jgi:hypothetical protein
VDWKNYNLDEVHAFYSRKLLFGSLKYANYTMHPKKTYKEICLILIMALVMVFNSSLVYTLQELHVMVGGEDPKKKLPIVCDRP